MARGQYSEEVRAACVAALLAGQEQSAVAAAYNVPAATLRSWKSRAAATGETAPIVSEEARGQVGALLVCYLVELIGALRKQLAVSGELDWLRKQSAGELAVLHGVGVDKVIRLLEALEKDKDEVKDEAKGEAKGEAS